MKEEERFARLEEENLRLKGENDKLLDIIVQLRLTLNRLIDRYIVENQEK